MIKMMRLLVVVGIIALIVVGVLYTMNMAANYVDDGIINHWN